MSYLTKQGLQYFLQKIKEKIDSIRSPKPNWNSPEDSESGILGRTHYSRFSEDISSKTLYAKPYPSFNEILAEVYSASALKVAFRICISDRIITLHSGHSSEILDLGGIKATFVWVYTGPSAVLKYSSPPLPTNYRVEISAIQVEKKLHSGYIDDDIARIYQLAEKQATLVSGENIKTVNGESLLGKGNLDIISDWDAKEGEAGYVKNRPFYAEFSEADNYSEKWTKGRLGDVYGSNLYIKVCANQLSVIETGVAPVWDYFHLTPNDVGFEKHNLRFDGQWEEDIFFG